MAFIINSNFTKLLFIYKLDWKFLYSLSGLVSGA